MTKMVNAPAEDETVAPAAGLAAMAMTSARIVLVDVWAAAEPSEMPTASAATTAEMKKERTRMMLDHTPAVVWLVYAAPLISFQASRMTNRLLISSVALAAAAALCGCNRGTGQATDQPAAAPKAQAPAVVQPGAPGQASAVVSSVPTFHDNNYIDADVKFMQGMIHHHNQALLMAAMIPSHSNSPQLISLGKKIQISQTGEIQAMKEWLTARKQEVPMIMPNGEAMMGTMDMGAMPGMLTADQMKALNEARGAKFDELFLTGMIQHHKGALTMVADLRALGGARETNIGDFTNQVDNDQRAEIVRMYGLLGRPVEK